MSLRRFCVVIVLVVVVEDVGSVVLPLWLFVLVLVSALVCDLVFELVCVC